jgi:replication factor A1
VSTTQSLKLASLKPYQKGLTVEFKIMKTQAVRKVRSRNDGSSHQVADVLVGDETGVMLLSLWDDDIAIVEDGKVFKLVGGQTGLFQGRLQLSLGRGGKLELSDATIAEVDTERNHSKTSRSSSRDRQGQNRSTDRRNPPTRRTRGFKWSRIERKSD